MPATEKFIVITSVFPPTEAVKKFADVSDWQLIVVGDKKTPTDWKCKGVTYLGPEDQLKQGFSILQNLPWNHYSRKMVGYLHAMSRGAEIIADTDDDNEPLPGWPNLPAFDGRFKTLSGNNFVNIYKYFTNEFVWPRGYPLNYILSKDSAQVREADHQVGSWQFLANEDPDVDAIYRLTNNRQIIFDDNATLVLKEGVICPTNSQNTIFRRELFPALYLPSFVTFRFTDILRGLVAQPLMWEHGFRQGFGPATVTQKRNPHNYLEDLESEIPAYLYSEKVVDIVKRVLASTKSKSMSKQLLEIYQALQRAQIVSGKEIELLKKWLKDLDKLEGETT